MKNKVHRDFDGGIVSEIDSKMNAMSLNSRSIRPPKHDRDQIRYYK